MNFTPFPNLSTERLTLRQIKIEDENEIFTLRSDERVLKFLIRPKAKTIEDARIFIRKIIDAISKNEVVYWVISLKNDLKLIGTICYWNIAKEHFRAEIGFELLPDFQGKGIMQEALTKIIDYGFKVLELNSIKAYVNPNNLSAIKLLERNNFIREAYLKKNCHYNGKFLDTAIYSLINDRMF